ncbi:MAG: Hpt domain-containing protein, partial [Rubripirellula sp.]
MNPSKNTAADAVATSNDKANIKATATASSMDKSLAEAEALIAAMEAAGTTCIQELALKPAKKAPAKKRATAKKKAAPKKADATPKAVATAPEAVVNTAPEPPAPKEFSDQDRELLNDYVIESQEHLSDIENQLLALESQGDDMDVALVNTVFRAIHSIKGAAGFLGLDVIQALAHRAEEILNKLRNKELSPTSEVIDTLLRSTDRLKGLLDDIDTSNHQDVTEYLDALEAILNADAPAQEPETHANPQESIEGLSDGALRDFFIESNDNLEQLERDMMSLESDPASESLINGVFRSIHTLKGTAGFLGFSKLERLSHVAENILGDVRTGRLAMDVEVGSAMLTTVDKVRELLTAIESTGTESDCGSNELTDALAALHANLLAGQTGSFEAKEGS